MEEGLAAQSASDNRLVLEKQANAALLGFAMFGVLLSRFDFALYNKRSINRLVRAQLCGDFKKGLHHKLPIHAMPVIVRREQIDVTSLVPRDLVTSDIGDVIWRDLLSQIEVANGRHRKSSYEDFIEWLEKLIEKCEADLLRDEGRTGDDAVAAIAATQALIDMTAAQLSGLGTWLGAFYDEGESLRKAPCARM